MRASLWLCFVMAGFLVIVVGGCGGKASRSSESGPLASPLVGSELASDSVEEPLVSTGEENETGTPVPIDPQPKSAATDLAAEKQAVLRVIRDYMQSHLSKVDREANPKDSYFDWRFAGDWCAVSQTLYFAQWDHESELIEFVLCKKAGSWQVVLAIEDYMTSEELSGYGITADVAKNLKIAHQ